MSSPKVIALHRTDRGRFSIDEEGRWQPSIKTTVAVGRQDGASVAYLCGLLNSELLDLWYALRGRTPRDVWRDYEPRPMGQMPYRRPEGEQRADRVATLVREIAANRRALLAYRPLFPELSRVVKDPWRTGPVEPDLAAFVADMPPSETVSVRLDDRLDAKLGPSPLGRASREGPELLAFRRGRVETGRIAGQAALLDLIEGILGPRVEDASSVLLPRNLEAFRATVEVRVATVSELLSEGRRLVEEVERLVCSLYDLPNELTDEVVAHAIRRAGSRVPADETE